MRSDCAALLTEIGGNCSESDELCFALILVMCGRLHKTFFSDVDMLLHSLFFFFLFVFFLLFNVSRPEPIEDSHLGTDASLQAVNLV